MAKKDEKAPGGVVDRGQYDYERVAFTGKDGKRRYSAGNGDAVAKVLLGLGNTALHRVAKDNGLTKYRGREFKNAGLFRMSLGHSLRALVRKGTAVTVGDVVVKSLDQKVTPPVEVAGRAPKHTVEIVPPPAKRRKDVKTISNKTPAARRRASAA